jgi:hypothetical protein
MLSFQYLFTEFHYLAPSHSNNLNSQIRIGKQNSLFVGLPVAMLQQKEESGT